MASRKNTRNILVKVFMVCIRIASRERPLRQGHSANHGSRFVAFRQQYGTNPRVCLTVRRGLVRPKDEEGGSEGIGLRGGRCNYGGTRHTLGRPAAPRVEDVP